MLILRFMSAHEAICLLNGETLQRDTKHADNGYNSTSVGFCFAIVKEHEPSGIYHAAKYLSGIAMMDTCLVGELAEGWAAKFKITTGRYKEGIVEELSATEYSLADFEGWQLLTPELPPVEQMFKIIASSNWLAPVLTRSSSDAKSETQG